MPSVRKLITVSSAASQRSTGVRQRNVKPASSARTPSTALCPDGNRTTAIAVITVIAPSWPASRPASIGPTMNASAFVDSSLLFATTTRSWPTRLGTAVTYPTRRIMPNIEVSAITTYSSHT
ncbi:hypothetical protein WEH80_21275 [Actinomycetes bacterium KLBMP 9759]